MKKILLPFILSIISSSCMSSNFTLTGTLYDSLPENFPVKVILTENYENLEYEEIGALQIRQDDMEDLSKAVELAKKEARIRGGDILFLISSGSKTSVSGNQYGIYSSESNTFIFVIGKIK